MKVRSSSLISLVSEPSQFVSRKLFLGLIVTLVLAGCKANPKQENVVTEPAPAAPAAKVEASQEQKQKEAEADAMVATLAKKSKFDEEDEVAEPVKPAPKPKAKPKPVVAAKPKPVAAPKPVVEKTVEAPTPKAPVVAAVVPAPEPEPAPVEKVSKSGSFKALNATRKDLPIEYGVWKIRSGEATLDKDIVITTPTWEMGEQGFMSQIWITVMDDKLLINSSSEILAPEGKSGIKIDGSDLIGFDRIVEDNIGVLDGDEWLDRLARANEIEIFMGFFT